MKSLVIFLSAGIALGCISCEDNDGKTIASDADSASANITKNEVNAADAEVPSTARTTFETKYPKATNVKWRRYQSVDKTELDQTDWNYRLDTSDYEVSFRFNDVDYIAWYDDGNWLRSATKVSDHAALPAAVTTAIKNEFPGFSIYDVDKEDRSDGVLYEIELKKGEEKWKVHFTPEGTVTKKKKKKDA